MGKSHLPVLTDKSCVKHIGKVFAKIYLPDMNFAFCLLNIWDQNKEA